MRRLGLFVQTKESHQGRHRLFFLQKKLVVCVFDSLFYEMNETCEGEKLFNSVKKLRQQYQMWFFFKDDDDLVFSNGADGVISVPAEGSIS